MPPSDTQVPPAAPAVTQTQVGADRFTIVRQPYAHDSAVKHVTGIDGAVPMRALRAARRA